MTIDGIQKDHTLPKALYGTRAGIFHLLQQQAAAPMPLDEEDRIDRPKQGLEPSKRTAAPKPLVNKTRFRETQRVAKGTASRFSMRAAKAPAPIVHATAARAQMSPAALAVLKGRWTANKATQPTRQARPLPKPITNQDVSRLFAEDHFDFQAAS